MAHSKGYTRVHFIDLLDQEGLKCRQGRACLTKHMWWAFKPGATTLETLAASEEPPGPMICVVLQGL